MQFKLEYLEENCIQHIDSRMNAENVCKFMNEAVLFKSQLLYEKCCKLFEEDTSNVLISFTFCELSQRALSAFLDVDGTNVLEIVIFQSIKIWMRHKCREQGLAVNGENMRMVIGDGLYKLRFPTMTVQDFANEVSTIGGFLTDSEIKQTFQKITVFKNEGIECPFKSDYRCRKNSLYFPVNDMKVLLRKGILREIHGQQLHSFDTLAGKIRYLEPGHKLYPPSFRLLLQCCVDMSNSYYSGLLSDKSNAQARRLVSTCLHDWKAAALGNPQDAGDQMTKFMTLRSALGNLTGWR